MILNLAQISSNTDWTAWPFVCLAAGMITVIMSITWLKIHAFLSLMLAAMVVGILNLFGTGKGQVTQAWINALEQPMLEMGSTAGKIAWVIALASIIGICMMESVAAEKIVRVMVRMLGETSAAWALLICGFILGIPVFFDTVFFLLIPLARGLSLKTGKNYALYIMAICSGAVITHTLVPPTPGPLFMAVNLNIHLGTGMLWGILIGVPVAAISMIAAERINHGLHISPHNGISQASESTGSLMNAQEAELPSLFGSLLPVALPVVLIGSASIVEAFELATYLGAFSGVFMVLGNKLMAMTLATAAAVIVLIRQTSLSKEVMSSKLNHALETAGVIILITAAGGAFGAMIKLAGIGDAIAGLSTTLGLSHILLGWMVAALMKTAQGSGTVSMITTTGMMASVIGDGSTLAYHPVYVFLAIGCGSGMVSWMNDSGFWVVCKLSGMTERETLKTWSVSLAVISISGLLLTLIASSLFPMRP